MANWTVNAVARNRHRLSELRERRGGIVNLLVPGSNRRQALSIRDRLVQWNGRDPIPGLESEMVVELLGNIQLAERNLTGRHLLRRCFALCGGLLPASAKKKGK